MLRHLVCSLVALMLVVGVALAEDKKVADDKKAKETKVSGTFVSYKDGTLTLKVKGKDDKEAKPMEFKVADDLKVTSNLGGSAKELVAKDAFKDLKGEVMLTVTTDDAKKVTAVRIEDPKKKEK